MSQRAKWGLGWIGLVLFGSLVITSVPIIRFYQHYWDQLQSLPQLVVMRENREGGRWTSLSQVSPWLPKALIATEDRTFYTNLGVSFEGIGRSLVVDLGTRQLTQGGSTLTQQLVRDTLLSPVKKFRRKISEALLALMLTTMYSKREILALYLNEVYLGDGAYGIEAASERYFGVMPKMLTLSESALLAGLPQAPTSYDPRVHYSLSKKRQWQVLESMVADQMISLTTARHVYRAPLILREARQ